MIVFVHGVPETAAIWDKVRQLIGGDTVALSMPGFGCARPEGFPATKDAYADWLAGELVAIGEPVHLVGHDWGAGLTYRIATSRPELLRSWAADVGNIVHPDYEWHDFAKLWQTPGAGEDFFRQQDATPAEQRAPTFEAMGVPADDALRMAQASDATMGGCVLDLYRSAVPNPHADWGAAAMGPTVAPGLVIHPSLDPFGDAARAEEVAAMLGARFEVLEGAGHWWPYQAPAAAADLLSHFHSSVG